jgi:hypothetical protein
VSRQVGPTLWLATARCTRSLEYARPSPRLTRDCRALSAPGTPNRQQKLFCVVAQTLVRLRLQDQFRGRQAYTFHRSANPLPERPMYWSLQDREEQTILRKRNSGPRYINCTREKFSEGCRCRSTGHPPVRATKADDVRKFAPTASPLDQRQRLLLPRFEGVGERHEYFRTG